MSDVFESLDREEEQEELAEYGRDETTVDRLVEVCDEVIEGSQASEWDVPADRADNSEFYARMYEDVEERLEGVTYGEDEIQGFVTRRLNELPVDSHYNPAAKVQGMYAGVLAELLTRRNEEEGERTRITIDGGGQEFSYLFTYTRKLDEVVVQNLRGRHVMSYAGRDGEAERLVLQDVGGEYVGNMMGNEGRVGAVVVAGCTGEPVASKIGYNGYVERCVLAGLEGENAGMDMADFGEVETAVLTSFETDENTRQLALNGAIDDLVYGDVPVLTETEDVEAFKRQLQGSRSDLLEADIGAVHQDEEVLSLAGSLAEDMSAEKLLQKIDELEAMLEERYG